MSLPRSLHGMAPLLWCARLVGLLPYAVHTTVFREPPKLRRSRVAHLASFTILVLYVTMIVFGNLISSRMVTFPTKASPLLMRVMSLVGVFLSAFFPTYLIITSLMASRATLYQRLLRYVWTLDEHFVIHQSSFVPFCKHHLVVVSFFTWAVISSALFLFPYLLWNFSIYVCLVQYILLFLCFLMSHVFCSLAFISKKYFDLINKHILQLCYVLWSQESEQDGRNKFHYQQELRSSLVDSLIGQKRITLKKHSLEKDIQMLRKRHFLAHNMCIEINKIFKNILLLLYIINAVILVTSIFLEVYNVQAGGPALLNVLIGGGCAMNAAMGGALAWAADKATTAGKGGTLEAVTALHLAAHDGPAEHEARQFLLQLRERPPPIFTAGGLFTVNVRFYISLLGSIVGYVVIILQFTTEN